MNLFRRSDPALVGVEFIITALLIKEFPVFSPFDDPPVFDHEDLVSFLDGAESVGNDKGGPILHKRLQAFLDE